jgi:hypothetical protein
MATDDHMDEALRWSETPLAQGLLNVYDRLSMEQGYAQGLAARDARVAVLVSALETAEHCLSECERQEQGKYPHTLKRVRDALAGRI